jgi:hypothetical protein
LPVDEDIDMGGLIEPTPIGQASRYQLQKWMRAVFEVVEKKHRGSLDSATCTFAVNLIDTFLMFLGHNGTSEKVKVAEADLLWNSANGEEIEVSTKILYGATTLTPRQIGRALADRMGMLAEKVMKKPYRWGVARGVKDTNARVSHDCADYMSHLTPTEKEVNATVKAATLASVEDDEVLDPSVLAMFMGMGHMNQRPGGGSQPARIAGMAGLREITSGH